MRILDHDERRARGLQLAHHLDEQRKQHGLYGHDIVPSPDGAANLAAGGTERNTVVRDAKSSGAWRAIMPGSCAEGSVCGKPTNQTREG